MKSFLLNYSSRYNYLLFQDKEIRHKMRNNYPNKRKRQTGETILRSCVTILLTVLSVSLDISVAHKNYSKYIKIAVVSLLLSALIALKVLQC